MRLLTTPWRHQQEAIEAVCSRPSTLLHAWMGTGKTLIALGVMARLSYRKVLVLCPKAVMRVWERQTAQHSSGAVVRVVDSGARRVERTREALEPTDSGETLILVANYEIMQNKEIAELICSFPWCMVIYDESHRIKAHNSVTSKACARIPAHRRVALTGTPMPHSPLDLFGQYRALDIDIFGKSWTRFCWNFAVKGGPMNQWIKGTKNHEQLAELMNRIRHEIRPEVLDLPPMHVVDIPYQMGEERLIYRQMEKDYIVMLGDMVVTAANACVMILRLQQILSGWMPVADNDALTLVQPKVKISDTRCKALEEILTDLHAKNEKIVVFAKFTGDIERIMQVAATVGMKCGEVTGRRKDLDRWDSGEIDLLAVQHQAGAEGIDLTKACHVIWYSLPWSRGLYDQAMARCHRPGQNRPVIVMRLIAEGTVDSRVARSLHNRENTIREILSHGGEDEAVAIIESLKRGEEDGHGEDSPIQRTVAKQAVAV